MKGEVFQLCSVITAAKNALNTQTFIQYEPLSYERGTVFQFVPEVEGQKGEMIEGVDSWYARCVYNGMEDVKILAPTAVKDRRVLGFVNTSQNIMLCFYPDDVIHMWMPRWVMDKDRKGWHIIYTEKIWENHPAGKPEYKDNTEIFKAALAEISKFSKELGFEGWSNVFNRSIAMLEGGFDHAADDEKIIEEFKKKGRSMPPRTTLSFRDITGIYLRQPPMRMYSAAWAHGMTDRLQRQQQKESWRSIISFPICSSIRLHLR